MLLKNTVVLGFALIIFRILGPKTNVTNLQRKDAENHFLAQIKNKYNILEKAFLSTGFKHSIMTKIKLRKFRLNKPLLKSTKIKLSLLFSGPNNPFYKKKHSISFIEKLSKMRKGSNNPMFKKEKSKKFIEQQTKDKKGKNNPMSKPLKIQDIETNKVIYFESRIAASHFLGYLSKTPLQNALKQNKKYLF